MIRKNRKRNRKEGFDYSQDNLYFVTICVQNRICCFGSIPVGTGRDLSTNHNHDLSKNKNPDLSALDSHSVNFNEDAINEKDEVQMKLNEYGEIAKNQMVWLQEQYPYVVVHCFVIMPNQTRILKLNRYQN